MRPTCQLSVPGSNAHSIQLHRLEALQALVAELGTVHFPLFLRLGAMPLLRVQPVTARALLAEVEAFLGRLGAWLAPGIRFWGPDGSELGVIYSRVDGKPLTEKNRVRLTVDETGIRVVVRQFPPPVGFRSAPDLPAGEFECYFTELTASAPGWLGRRSEVMTGAGSPVSLEYLPLPPVTRWDYSRVAGTPAIARVDHLLAPAPEVFRDILHALQTACTDSLRLKQPLQIRTDK